MPVKNAGEYINDSVRSILDQSYTNFEFIIIDDGSSDNSPVLLGKYNDPRIIYYQRENEGLINQLNFGLSVAKGEFIARMDADDLCDSRRFKLQIDFLKDNIDVHLVGSNYYYIDQNGKFIVEKKFPECHSDIEFMMPVTTSVLHSSILVYKEELNKIKGYDNSKLYNEDHDLFLRLIENGCIMHNIQIPLYSYRIGNGSLASRNMVTQQNNVYNSGISYLENKYCGNDRNSFDYLYRSALLEYYRGSVSKARKIFMKIALSYPSRIFPIMRYMIISLLGNKLVGLLRKLNVFRKISFMMNRYFHKDFNSISKPA